MLTQQPERPTPRWLFGCAGALPLLLTGGWLVADREQPSSFSPVRETVSVTSGYAGTDRWIMTVALVLVAICFFVLAVGFVQIRLIARVGLMVAGAAALGIACFPEPVGGTTLPHTICSTAGAFVIATWPACLTQQRVNRRITGQAVCAAATAVFGALLGWLIIEAIHGPRLGAAERIGSSLELCWPFVVAASFHHADAAPEPTQRPTREGHRASRRLIGGRVDGAGRRVR